jgi:dTDP-4-amino-4,6-dideoxy-D-galactose acyltransferase
LKTKSDQLKLRHLDWDTSFFGFNVASIHLASLEEEQWPSLASQVRATGARLIYLSVDQKVTHDFQGYSDISVRYVDRKTTYHKRLGGARLDAIDLESVVDKSLTAKDLGKLIALARQSGAYSRFRKDPDISVERFNEMFELWMRNSLSKSIAEDVIVERQGDDIAGFVTVGVKGGSAVIGIIAVDEYFRGKGIGKRLINAASHRLSDLGYLELRVVTQGENIAACRFYESAGFEVESVVHYYHIWKNSTNED